MFKTGFKAFVFSFSVSLFAILAAHRAFLHKNPSVSEPLQVDKKNIVLFLKSTLPTKAPTQKVTLNALPNIPSLVPEPLQSQEPEVILASPSDDVDFPLEIVSEPQPENNSTLASSESLAGADILYAPDIPQDTPKIEAEPLYQPDQSDSKSFSPPPVVKLAADEPVFEPQSLPEESVKKAENKAVFAQKDLVPLQKTAKPLRKSSHVVFGNPDNMNHVALSQTDVPIESMLTSPSDEVKEKPTAKEWKPLDDSPWLVAQANAGAKNLFMRSEKSKEEVDAAFAKAPLADGVKLAAEGGVDNLVIPLKEELKDPNLIPKLAYPSSSEDAVKEKQMSEQEKKETVLSVIEDEDISLEAPKNEPPKEEKPLKEKKEGLLNKLNSMLSKTTKDISEAKDKAIAKAQARRSLKKRLAKSRPVSIMPTEIRLSFQPNRAEISGQTLRWVQAFASKAAESSDVILEIRIDGTSSPLLQQRRLNLLHNILTHKGVAYSKISTVFTSREPNSFILRAIKPKNGNTGENKKIDNWHQTQYIQW